MPRQKCTICQHPKLQAIDAAHMAGEPVRSIAKRFGVTPASADRHFHHAEHEKKRQNTGEIAHIDEEIKKLIRAQNRAKKRRDNGLALQISKELRNWFVLRTKTAVAAIGAESSKTDEQLSPAEALTLAKAVIEGQLTDSDVRSWLAGLIERIGLTGSVLDGRAQVIPTEGQY